MSVFNSPATSAKRIPVSDTKATSHPRSSSSDRHCCWTLRISSIGIGSLLVTPARRSWYIPTNGFFKIKRILRDSEVHHRPYGTHDTAHTGPSHAFSNQIIPILQGISPGVVCQVLCPTSLNQIGTRPLSSSMKGLAFIGTLLNKVCLQGLRQRDIGFRSCDTSGWVCRNKT